MIPDPFDWAEARYGKPKVDGFFNVMGWLFVGVSALVIIGFALAVVVAILDAVA